MKGEVSAIISTTNAHANPSRYPILAKHIARADSSTSPSAYSPSIGTGRLPLFKQSTHALNNRVSTNPQGRGRGGGGGTHYHARSRSYDQRNARIPTMPGRSTPGFHRPGRQHHQRCASTAPRATGENNSARTHAPSVHVPVRRVVFPGEGPGDLEVFSLRHEELNGNGRVLLHSVHHEGVQVVRTPQQLQARQQAPGDGKNNETQNATNREGKDSDKRLTGGETLRAVNYPNERAHGIDYLYGCGIALGIRSEARWLLYRIASRPNTARHRNALRCIALKRTRPTEPLRAEGTDAAGG